jgi:hypothetical protein
MRGQFPLMLVVGVDTLKGVALGRSRGASLVVAGLFRYCVLLLPNEGLLSSCSALCSYYLLPLDLADFLIALLVITTVEGESRGTRWSNNNNSGRRESE